MSMHAAEQEFVEALADATARNLIHWETVPHDDREISRTEVDGDVVQIEFVYFPVAVGGAFEKVLATVSGMKIYFQVAAGTPAYHILRDMLAPQQSRESGVKGLTNRECAACWRVHNEFIACPHSPLTHISSKSS
jgi:hypothetical protein